MTPEGASVSVQLVPPHPCRVELRRRYCQCGTLLAEDDGMYFVILTKHHGIMRCPGSFLEGHCRRCGVPFRINHLTMA